MPGTSHALDHVVEYRDLVHSGALRREDNVVELLEPLVDGVVRLIELPRVRPAQHAEQAGPENRRWVEAGAALIQQHGLRMPPNCNACGSSKSSCDQGADLREHVAQKQRAKAVTGTSPFGDVRVQRVHNGFHVKALHAPAR